MAFAIQWSAHQSNIVGIKAVHSKIFLPPDHPIDRSLIDPHALTTIETLQQAGHTAYLVGGGVRDLLMGFHPKDFDISTSARPDEIKKLFHRQCILIGRRFRLAHIRFGNRIFEVSTFRAGDPNTSSLIIHDNRWGTESEDVLRRDFTMNALFYDPTKEAILDYVGGVEDVRRGLLKTIGDPEVRFRQDPVRMIRMIKFQARFGFRCDDKAVTAMRRCRQEILKSAPARVLEELFKMLESGKAELFFLLMTDHGFIELLFPCFHHFFSGPTREIAASYLRAVDEILNRPGNQGLDRSVLLAAIVFPILEEELRTLILDRQGPVSTRDVAHLTETLLHGIMISSFVHFPKRLLGNLYLTIVNQFRMTPLTGHPKFHIRFRSHEDHLLSLELLRIRALVRPELGAVCDQWEATIDCHHRPS
jgi:poly(A) polymerase